jgi:hypothetical protein
MAGESVVMEFASFGTVGVVVLRGAVVTTTPPVVTVTMETVSTTGTSPKEEEAGAVDVHCRLFGESAFPHPLTTRVNRPPAIILLVDLFAPAFIAPPHWW